MLRKKKMSILPVTVLGDTILRKKSEKIEEVDGELIQLIKDMFETMRNASGVGLAANQVAVNKSLFVVDLSPVKGYESYKPMIFINPKIVAFSRDKNIIEEGCLSLPSLRVDVERPERVKIEFQDLDLKKQSIEADEFLARVIQHEYDHTKGVLFIDKISEDQLAEIKDELKLIKNRKTEVDYPITRKKVKIK